MDHFKEICDKIKEKYGTFFIESAVETDLFYYIYLSDKYGNHYDDFPLCVGKASGDVSRNNELVFYEGEKECNIPEDFRTYRDLVRERLLKEASEDDSGKPQLSQVEEAVELLFQEGTYNYELSELYAVCSYFAHLVAEVWADDNQCNESEAAEDDTVDVSHDVIKDSIAKDNEEYSIIENENAEEADDELDDIFGEETYQGILDDFRIESFLELSRERKLCEAQDYFYIPEFMEQFRETSEEILSIAVSYRKKGVLDSGQYESKKNSYAEQVNDCKATLEELNDPFCSKPYLEENLEWLTHQTEMEMAFCENRSTEQSERMLEEERYSRFDFTDDDLKDEDSFMAKIKLMFDTIDDEIGWGKN